MFLAVFCKMPYMRYAWQSSFFNNLILCNIRVKGVLVRVPCPGWAKPVIKIKLG